MDVDNAPVKKPNRVGSISLGIAFLAFIASMAAKVFVFRGAEPFWLACAIGAFEAAVVGGVADFYAVTALFKKIPIMKSIPPFNAHMDLINRNKDAIVESVISMVNQFINGTSIAAHIQKSIDSRGQSPSVVDFRRILAFELERMVQTRLVRNIARAQLEKISDSFTSGDKKKRFESRMGERLDDAGVTGLENFMIKKVATEYIRKHVYDKHDGRKQKLWDPIIGSCERMVMATSKKIAEDSGELTLDIDFRQYLRDLVGDLDRPDSTLGQALGEITESSIDPIIRTAMTGMDISNFVKDYVWHDLQYIRLNGAIVGGLVGLLLVIGKQLLSG